MKRLTKALLAKINKTQSIIEKAYASYPHDKTVVAWTGGKDSTVLLHIIKNIFGSTVPFPVMFNDSTMEFDEVYEFIDTISNSWKLNLVIVSHNTEELSAFQKAETASIKLELSRVMKIHAIESFQKKHGIEAFIAGIRWDEHEARSKETYFSKRSDHTRVHPILHFSEADIWEYIHAFDVPYVSLYDRGYRSLGEKPFTQKSKKDGGERSGREPDKEQLMQKLRAMGYW